MKKRGMVRNSRFEIKNGFIIWDLKRTDPNNCQLFRHYLQLKTIGNVSDEEILANKLYPF